MNLPQELLVYYYKVFGDMQPSLRVNKDCDLGLSSRSFWQRISRKVSKYVIPRTSVKCQRCLGEKCHHLQYLRICEDKH